MHGDADRSVSSGQVGRIAAGANGVRRIALAHPAVSPLVATRPPAAPWVRPPLRSVRWIQSLLPALVTQGCTQEQAVVAHRSCPSSLLGHLLLEVASRGVAINAVDDPDGDPAATLGDLAHAPLPRRPSTDTVQIRSGKHRLHRGAPGTVL